ncbi:MAG: bacterial transcriptional activator domain-containing protein, partial [Deltaproteobacteria bacterium]|nr:bacterial transcriptional activator domain-containing protein [Deltaproteobacteria bacterium]
RDLGSEKCIRLKEGRLSLDPMECRLDVWEFDRLLGKADALWKDDRDKAIGLIENAVGLYRGGFLPEDGGAGWATSMRERMRSKFIGALHRLGHYCEEQGAYDRAAGYYAKGLEADDLSEEFYQSLMLCYHAMGRNAEALSVYRTCRSVLHDVLNIEPSQKTESICRDIKASSK